MDCSNKAAQDWWISVPLRGVRRPTHIAARPVQLCLQHACSLAQAHSSPHKYSQYSSIHLLLFFFPYIYFLTAFDHHHSYHRTAHTKDGNGTYKGVPVADLIDGVLADSAGYELYSYKNISIPRIEALEDAKFAMMARLQAEFTKLNGGIVMANGAYMCRVA